MLKVLFVIGSDKSIGSMILLKPTGFNYDWYYSCSFLALFTYFLLCFSVAGLGAEPNSSGGKIKYRARIRSSRMWPMKCISYVM